jgi:hypothetical protein
MTMPLILENKYLKIGSKYLILENMPKSLHTNQKRGRGRPRLGRKAYCVRMLPETHDLVIDMAGRQGLNLLEFLDRLASDWRWKLGRVKSKGGSVEGQLGQLTLDTFDAIRAVECVVHDVGSVGTNKTPVPVLRVLRELKLTCEELLELLKDV